MSVVRPGRGQWILGPRPITTMDDGATHHLAENLWLSADAELNVSVGEGAGAKIWLVGYALDFREPFATDTEIVQAIADSYRGADSIGPLTAGLSGRWALVIDDGPNRLVALDACALRQAFHTADGWCSSSLDLLHEHLGLGYSPEATAFWTSGEQRWWPGIRSAIDSVSRLLPSRILDLRTGRSQMMPPHVPSDSTNGPTGLVDILRESIVGTMTAANHRFDPLLLITGGTDSRLLLAASRAFAGSLDLVTLASRTMFGSHEDAEHAAAMCAALDLSHRVIVPPVELSTDFAPLVERHGVWSHRLYALNNQALAAVVTPSTLGVTGHTGEILRGARGYRVTSGVRPTGDAFATAIGLGGDEFVRRALDDWLDGIGQNPNEGLEVSDRFYWEQRVGSWLAGWVSEADLVWPDHLAPFSNRLAISAAHALPKAWRPSPVLFRTLTEQLWPELSTMNLLPKRADRRRSLPSRIRRRLTGR